MKKVFYPEYVEAFECIAQDCEETCCGFWSVENGKRTFMPCQHFTDDKLCDMQLSGNYHKLCDACKAFPRAIHYAKPDGWEYSLHLSCPEAVRLMMKQKQPLRFKQDDDSTLIPTDSKPTAAPEREAQKTGGSVIESDELIEAVRRQCIAIMQRQQAPLQSRLADVGRFLYGLDAVFNADSLEAPANFEMPDAAHLTPSAYCEALYHATQEIDDAVLPSQQAVNAAVVNVAFAADTSHALYLFKEDLISKTDGTTQGDVTAFLTEQLDSLYSDAVLQSYLEKEPYVVENFIVNTMYTTQFPFHSGERSKTFLERYLRLPVQYHLFAYLLQTLANDDETQNQTMEKIALAIYKYYK